MRVIAGRYGGRRLVAPAGAATRPPADRVREALFSILGTRVEGTDVLDLFAGSGALGLEALSRGAASATFVEEARAAVLALASNIAALGVDAETSLISADARAALKRLAREEARFGLVFADPPYAAKETAETLDALVRSGVLLEGAWVVLEHAARTTPPPAPPACALRFTRTYGDTALTFYRHSTTEAA